MNDVQQFNALSKQRLDFTSLPDGGQRARMTITLPPMAGYPNGRSFTFVEDLTATDVKKYAAEIAGIEIGCAMSMAPISGVEVGNIFKDIGKAIGGGVKAIGKVAKKVVTSKVMQTAAKGLAMIAPALGPMAAPALAISGGIGVAGKLLASKTAQSVNAPLASQQLAESAMSDARKLTKTSGGLSGLLKIASSKVASASNLVNKVMQQKPAAPSGGGDVLSLARAGRVRSSSGGAVSAAQLQQAAGLGRLFFIAA